MSPTTPGIHHVTAMAGDPMANADFYIGTLGLRMVKRTVNHDDTGTYHFYFGDGQTQTTAYLTSEESVDCWEGRLESEDVDYERERRSAETVLRFSDPDGIELELVAADAPTDAVSDR